jgi:hypothetical protein
MVDRSIELKEVVEERNRLTKANPGLAKSFSKFLEDWKAYESMMRQSEKTNQKESRAHQKTYYKVQE